MSLHAHGATTDSPTCLFTGAALDASTTEEHTILRSLGGRIRSRTVSSSAFNHACGSRVDPFLLFPYAHIMATLRPLLSNEHKCGDLQVEIPGDNGRFVIDKDGRLVLRGIKIVSKDPVTGRPNVFASMDRARLQQFADQVAPAKPLTEHTVAQTTQTEWFLESPCICPEIELSALKCLLLTFDHLLGGTSDSFTRSPDLGDVRQFVRSAIDSGTIDFPALGRYSIVIQYDASHILKCLRDKCEPPSRPFEHIMVASGNAATRTIDAVWCVLGIDPMGFRLSSRWRGSDFTCLVASSIMQGGGVVGPHTWHHPTSLCKPNDFRSFQATKPTDERAVECMKVIAPYRQDAYRRAVALVEMNADDHVAHAIASSALLAESGDHSIEAAIRTRLCRLYREQISRPENLQLVNQAIETRMSTIPPGSCLASIPQEADINNVDWTMWLAAYRAILADLQPSLGVPGYVFTNSINITTQQSGLHRLGIDSRSP